MLDLATRNQIPPEICFSDFQSQPTLCYPASTSAGLSSSGIYFASSSVPLILTLELCDWSSVVMLRA